MKKVLVVEDDEILAKLLEHSLKEEAYDVMFAEDGELGLEMAKSVRPDIILLDIMLPKMDGFEVCRSLKSDENFKSVPIIMMTGLADTENTIKGFSTGADDYVFKPFNMPELLARVKSQLKKKELYDKEKIEGKEKSTLLDLSKSFSNAMDPYETLFTIVSKIAEVIKIKRCSIIYVDSSKKEAYVMVSHDSKKVKRLKVDIDKYPEIQKIMETGKPVVIDDVCNDPVLLPVREVLNLIDIRSIMAFPIAFKDALIGSLILRTTRRESPFNEREIRFCDVISHLAAAPLKNAYLFDILHKEKEEEKEKRLGAEKAIQSAQMLLEVICHVQSQFILDSDPKLSFERLLENLLVLTKSEYGFIGEIQYATEGDPYLKTHAITNIAWNEDTLKFYKENTPEGMRFTNLKTLFGAVITSGNPVISNEPSNDPRRGGLPKGHPPLNAFLGLPFFKGEKITGMVGIANRPSGYDQELVEFLRPFLTTCANIMEASQSEIRRNDAEEALKKNEEKFRLLYENIPVPYQSLDEHGRLIEVNQTFLDTLGYSKEEIIGKWFGDLIVPQYIEFFKTSFSLFKEKGEVNGVEFEIKKKNGSDISVLLAGRISRDANGSFKQTYCAWEDITERKVARQMLEKAVAEWNNTFNSISDFVSIHDTEFKIVKANKAVLDFFGKEPEEVLGKYCYEIFHGKNEPWDNCPHARTLETKQPKTEEIFDPHIGRPLLVTTCPIIEKDGNLSGSVHIAKDISEHKKREDELKEKTEFLEQFQRIAVGRELDMIRLKREVNLLLERLGEPKKYEEVDEINDD